VRASPRRNELPAARRYCKIDAHAEWLRLTLGTWQGIFLWEHRSGPHRREVIVTLQGEKA